MQISYADDFAMELAGTINIDRMSGRFEELYEHVPDDQIIVDIAEKVYHASFLQEEGRSLSLSVGFAPSSLVAILKEASKDWSWIPFIEPIAMTVGSLVKVAPAAEVDRTLIVVSDEGEIGELRIVGFLALGSPFDHVLKNRLGVARTPRLLNISTRRAGHLEGKLGSTSLCELNSGETFTDFVEEPPDALSSLIIALNYSVAKDLGFEPGYVSVMPVRNFLIGVLAAVEAERHGGTILLIPDEWVESEQFERYLDVKYKTSANIVWEVCCDVFRYVELRRANELQGYEFELRGITQELERCAKAVARMANVDGAVVVTDRMRLVGFGAEIINMDTRWQPDVEDSEGREINFKENGTRHRSAYRWVWETSGMAFVMSSDGGVKFVWKDETIVRVYRPRDMMGVLKRISRLNLL